MWRLPEFTSRGVSLVAHADVSDCLYNRIYWQENIVCIPSQTYFPVKRSLSNNAETSHFSTAALSCLSAFLPHQIYALLEAAGLEFRP